MPTSTPYLQTTSRDE
ncbi:uncharacterized protein RCC_10542 [Ramularia collo-cygni]|uniref:Uncharacterized protein n=1 Tax=Ramularia collo-cygni TaxID=112498 RepID=A0A2D3VP52_9PEZI|nr:uncharacterized protein RCC_10542 [Ramularia collo-cygni]